MASVLVDIVWRRERVAGGLMNRILLALLTTLICAVMTRAQSELIPENLPLSRPQTSQIIAVRIESVQQGSNRILPDAPIPVLPGLQDGPLPCPAGVGKPCALLGGRLYFRDPVHFTEHDKSWADAMKNKGMLFGVSMNVAAAVWDYETTRQCIDAHRGKEANPLMGQSRAQELSVGISISALTYYMAGKLKEQGGGNYAFGVLWGGTMLHFFAGAHNWAACHR
jgi:hypothetical protein